MKNSHLKQFSLGVMATMVISACGGGGGGSSAGPQSSSFGKITGFGSIYVNGIEYETDSASIEIDGRSASESDLETGMIVTVYGDVNGLTGQAHYISNSDEIEGIVLSTNILADQTGTMNIMGQTVTVDDRTVFESYVAGVTSPSTVAAGNIVEVNGFSDGQGQVFATRIEVKSADLTSYLTTHPEGVEVKGLVSNIDPVAMTFELGGITVDYTSAVLDMNGGLTEGSYVEVKSTAGLNGAGELVASRVEDERYESATYDSHEDDELEIHGTITVSYANGSFMLDNTTVVVDQQTELDGLTIADLTAGTYVEVEGLIDASGQLIADEVELEDDIDTEVSGTITSIDSSGNNIGTVTLANGSIIHIDNNTIMLDEQDEGVTPVAQFNLTYLAVGDYVEVKAFTNANGDLVAVKLERDDAPTP